MKTGLALPTEAQWEYACRAGTRTPFSFGENITTEQANFNSLGPASVSAFEPNAFGLYQMHGNVQEWCADNYDRDFFSNSEATRDDPICIDFTGPSNYVVRGGSWESSAYHCRSGYRDFSTASARSDLGLRPLGLRPAF